MNESDKVYVEDLAWIGWQMLPDHVKAEIVRELEPLADVASENWPWTRVKRWHSDLPETLYALPVWNGASETFVLFSAKGSRIHVEALSSRQKIERASGRRVEEFIRP